MKLALFPVQLQDCLLDLPDQRIAFFDRHVTAAVNLQRNLFGLDIREELYAGTVLGVGKLHRDQHADGG